MYMAVTVPTEKLDDAQALLSNWKGQLGVKIAGSDTKSTGLMVDTLTTSPISIGLAREALEKLLRPVGGSFGMKGEWLEAFEAQRRK